MSNESLIQVPPNVAEPIVLQRFLLRLVEELDIILGKRANSSEDQYVAQKELLDAADALEVAITDARARLDAAIALIEQELEDAVDDRDDEIKELEERNKEQDTLINELVNFSWFRPFTVGFPGRNTNGTVTPNIEYNIASVTRSAIGVYDIVLTDPLDSSGDELLARTQGLLNFNIADSATSEDYTVRLTSVNSTAGTLTVEIFAVAQGTGNKLEYVPYDPLSTDNVNVIGMYTPVGVSL